jgi:hypothetical protein
LHRDKCRSVGTVWEWKSIVREVAVHRGSVCRPLRRADIADVWWSWSTIASCARSVSFL